MDAFHYNPGGGRIGEQMYDWRLFRRNIMQDDIWDLMQDGSAHIHGQIGLITPSTTGLKYKCAYKIMPNMGILVGIDERDFYLPREEPEVEEVLWHGEDFD